MRRCSPAPLIDERPAHAERLTHALPRPQRHPREPAGARRRARRRRPRWDTTRIALLGDLVGYGADPAAVIDRTLALDPLAIVRGNHDKVCAGLEPASLFNEAARQSIEWTAACPRRRPSSAVGRLPRGRSKSTTDSTICHGAPFDEDYYVFDDADALPSDGRGGHTHLSLRSHAPARGLPADEAPPRGRGRAGCEFAAAGARTRADQRRVRRPAARRRSARGLRPPRPRRQRADDAPRAVRRRRPRRRGSWLRACPPWLAHRLARGQ